MSNTKKFLENILKESDEVPYCDDVNCESVKEDKFPPTNFIKRDWEKLQKDPMINVKEHWSDAYYQEVIDFGKELKEAEEEEVQTEEQPEETQEESANEFEQLSPEVQTMLNDMSNDNAMYKWVIDDVMDSVIDYEGDSMDEKLKSRLEEITEHGCQSGTVGSLIYYDDTVKFFDNFNDEIYDMIEDYYGAESVLDMLKQHCELIDIVMGSDSVKNYLAWMAYEVTCSNILDGIESA